MEGQFFSPSPSNSLGLVAVVLSAENQKISASVLSDLCRQMRQTGSRSRGTSCCQLRGPLPPAEWTVKVQAVWWYRVSSLAYCIPGSLAAIRPEPLAQFVSALLRATDAPVPRVLSKPIVAQAYPCCALFPFRLMGIAVTLNGFASYAADVIYYGEAESAWKRIDVWLATSNTIVQARAPAI